MRWEKEQLLDPRWQRKRLEVFSRDKWKCSVCGRQDMTLHAHHLEDQDSLPPWEYDNDEIITLCKECHFYIHHRKQRLFLLKYRLEAKQRHGWDKELSFQLDRVNLALGV